MTNTVLGLFRHGQTDWNIDLRLQGTAEIPLNDFGIAQVAAASEVLDIDSWDVVLTSPLGRAKQTAEILLQGSPAKQLQIEPMLIERSFGIGEGMLYSEWHDTYGQLEDIPGAESNTSVIQRSRDLLSQLSAQYSGARILAVSHGALIRYLLSEVTSGQVPPKGERLQNASLHILRHDDAWSLDAWAPNPLGQSVEGVQ
ncbi:MAG: histidine phosphatase family protein [Aquiluna sp.]|nr:histidine phosphatase family protein [Aquiluna sp.]